MSRISDMIDDWVMEVYGSSQVPQNFVTYLIAWFPVYRRQAAALWVDLQELELPAGPMPIPDISFLDAAAEEK